LWSDTDPYLYDLSVKTGDDHYTLKVGIRTIAVESGHILLNGQPVKMNGFGRHEDFIASGKGLNLPLMVKDYQLMRWTGANSYRTSHYPYSEEEMQMADRQGYLIIDEIPAVSLQFESDENAAIRLQMCLQQLDELISRDKNHPGVVMWSVANEPLPSNLNQAAVGSRNSDPSVLRGKTFLDNLLQRARELDPTRLVTLVTVMGGPQEWMQNCDVVCMNRYWGWYVLGGELEKAIISLEQELDGVWAMWHKPIIMTEFGADTMAGMHGQPDVMWTEEYQASYIRGYLEVASRKDYVAGMQVWNFADFAAVQSITRVGGLNMKGVFTRTRQPKMAAHILREYWVKK
jgi:beta-glucuronidase